MLDAEIQITTVKREDGEKMNNPGVWDWSVYRKLLSLDDPTSHEFSKALCWNVFNAAEETSSLIAKSLQDRKMIDAGETAKSFASQTHAIGLLRLTKSLLLFHRFCVTCPSTQVPAPVAATPAIPDTAADLKPNSAGKQAAKEKAVVLPPRQTRKEFLAQNDIDIAKAQELAKVIVDEAEEGEEWILRWYQEKPLRDIDTA